MKKIYHSAKFKKYNEKRIKRALEDTRWSESKKHGRIRRGQKPDLRQLRDGRRRRVIAPTIFGFAANPDETMVFFREIDRYVKERKRIRVDFGSITYLGPDALLYLVARFDHYDQQKIKYDIAGNVPEHENCRRLLEASGFYEYVSQKPKLGESSRHILKIERHSEVHGTLAQRIHDFCLEHLKEPPSQKSKDIYRAIVELMNNTREHAYPNDGHMLRWYAMALYNTQRKCIDIVFLDNGVGIPETIRKNFAEKFISKVVKQPD